MPYIPNLIPTEHQVLPEYFNDRNPVNRQRDQPPSPLWYFAAIVLGAAALINHDRPWMAAFLALAAALCTPYGKRKLENAGRFRLTTRIRLLFCLILLTPDIPLFYYYQQTEADAAAQIEALHQQALQYSADSLKSEQQREDTLHQQIKLALSQDPKTAWMTLTNAGRLSKSKTDEDSLTEALHPVALTLSDQLIRESRYDQAQSILADQFKREPGSPSLLYNRALCFYRAGNIRQAVNDLDSARTNGYKEAGKLYNKLNPLKKRVAYYCTLCCDGTTSDATGRGACSWHGGVCQWNHPIYETYRKYPSKNDSL